MLPIPGSHIVMRATIGVAWLSALERWVSHSIMQTRTWMECAGHRNEHFGGTHCCLHPDSLCGPSDLLEHQVPCGQRSKLRWFTPLRGCSERSIFGYGVSYHRNHGDGPGRAGLSICSAGRSPRNSSEAFKPLGWITLLFVWDHWSSTSLSS